MKKLLVATSSIAMLIIGFAIAKGEYNTEWYYKKVFSESDVGIFASFIQSLKDPICFIQQEDDVVSIDIVDVGWIEDRRFLVSALVSCREPEKAELHPEINFYTNYESSSQNSMSTDQFLWTPEGYGPVSEKMDDSDKQLVLFDVHGIEINGMECMQSWDYIRLADGRLFFYAECDLEWIKNNDTRSQAKRARLKLSNDPDRAIVTLFYTTTKHEDESADLLFTDYDSKYVEVFVETE